MVSVMHMSILLRVFLIVCALLVLGFILRRIKKAEIHTADTVFWLLFAASLVLVAAFPRIAFLFSNFLGIESPANFVFLFVIAILFIREFISTIEIAKLREKLHMLTEEVALREHEGKLKDKNRES